MTFENFKRDLMKKIPPPPGAPPEWILVFDYLFASCWNAAVDEVCDKVFESENLDLNEAELSAACRAPISPELLALAMTAGGRAS